MRRQLADSSVGFLRKFLLGWIFISLVVLVYSSVFVPYVVSAPGVLMLVGLLSWSALHRGHVRAARWIIVLPLVVLMPAVAMLFNGIRTPILVSAPMMLLLAGWLLGWRVMMGIALFFSTSFVLMWQAEARGWWTMPIPLRESEVWVMVLLSVLGLTAVITGSLVRNFEADFQREAALQYRLGQVLDFTESMLLLSPVPMRVFEASGACIKVNTAYASLMGVSRDVLLRQRFQSIEMWQKTGLVDDAERCLAALEPIDRELSVVTSTGRSLWLQVHLLPIESQGQRLLLAQLIDVTERHQLSLELAHFAFHDSLTQLANRRLFYERLGSALRRRDRHPQAGAVLLLDLNHFKQLNDTHGHEIGDLMLVEVARRLRSAVREADTVARLGGDEFVVLLEGLDPQPEVAQAQVHQIRDKIDAVLAEPYALGTVLWQASASIGVRVFPAHGDCDVQSLLRAADAAMYAAKSAHRHPQRALPDGLPPGDSVAA